MERLLDKGLVLVCGVALFSLMSYSTTTVIGLLAVLIVASLFEVSWLPEHFRIALLVAFLIASLVFPEFVLFLPVVAYDCLRLRWWALRLAWFLPLIASIAALPLLALLFVCLVAAVACGLSLRSTQVERVQKSFTVLRDDLQETSLALERKNRDLQEKQDYEVTLATLNERSRIAREIHDNVGHLLTRSVLQVEALQVVHASDAVVVNGLVQVGTTLHEALDTVRTSVHDLHDDSFDLQTQLRALAEVTESLEVALEYDVVEMPAPVGYCFAAIVREALSNTTRHSNADRVAISVIELPAFFRLSVQDNGSKVVKVPLAPGGEADFGQVQTAQIIGAGRVSAPASRGIGLQTMEGRARALGGVFRTDFDRGFRVFVSVPKEGLS